MVDISSREYWNVLSPLLDESEIMKFSYSLYCAALSSHTLRYLRASVMYKNVFYSRSHLNCSYLPNFKPNLCVDDSSSSTPQYLGAHILSCRVSAYSNYPTIQRYIVCDADSVIT
jgi:hypothetical protein